MTITWILRIARWARRPPGPRKVRLWLIVLGLALSIGRIEYLFGWPDMLLLEPRRSVLRK